MKTAISLLQLVLIAGALAPRLAALRRPGVFNVTDYGATGKKDQDARQAIQRAIDTCAAAGGGTVYFPAGTYSISGSINVHTANVRVYGDGDASSIKTDAPASRSPSPIRFPRWATSSTGARSAR